MRPAHRFALPAVLTGLLAAPLVALTAAPAVAAEVHPRPASGVYDVDGHGWGHGRGMSQWGAQGAAKQGLSSDQITAFYYPSTTKSVLADSPIRVLLQADEGVDTQVIPAAGSTATDEATGATLALSTTPKRWRALATSAGLALQSWDGTTWTAVPLGGKTAVTGPVRFGGTTVVRVVFPGGSSRDYRGTVRAVKTGTTSLQTIDVLSLEDYLLGVVPRESSSSWAAAALQSQAIAARSYSANKRSRVSSTARYDICDTTQCQVFGGTALYTASGTRTALEPATTTEAVRATRGVVRTYNGTPILSEYSSSNGGWSTDGGLPYLRAQRDDYDGVVPNSVHSWKASLRVTDLERRYPAVGTLQALEVTRRDGNGEWGGRVKEVLLRGTKDGQPVTVTTTGAGIYNARSWPANADGLKSSWWRISAAAGASVVSRSAAPDLVKPPGASLGRLTTVLRNTGTTAWPTADLHLAVASPPGQADPLAGGSTRPGRYTGTAPSVAPGETAEFAVALDAAGVPPALHGRAYRLRIGDGPVFGDSVSWTVRVDGPLFAATQAEPVAAAPGTPPPVGGAPPVVFADGRTVVVPRNGSTSLRISSRNAGNLDWPVGPSTPVLLGTSGPRDRASASSGSTWPAANRAVRLGGTTAVSPGQVGTFDLTLHGGGGAVGVSSESFEPLWAGKHWIDGHVTPLTVVRTDPSQSRLALTDLAPPGSLALTTAPGTTTLTVRMRNVGGSAWTLGRESLATPADAPYALRTSAWPLPSRPPALSRNVTRPGTTTVHPGEVGEWRVPLSAQGQAAGSHPLRLQLVASSTVPSAGRTTAAFRSHAFEKAAARKAESSARYGPALSTAVSVTKAVVSASLVASSPSVTVPQSGTATTWYDVRNTGNTTWAVGGPVRSVALQSGGSPSRHASWLSPTRPSSITANRTRPGATSVAPGEVARLSFVLAGNGRTAGARSEPFGLLWEGFASTSLRVTLSYSVR